MTTEALSPVAAMQKVAASVKDVESSAYTFELAGSGLTLKGHGAFRTKPDLAMQTVFESVSAAGMNVGGFLGLGGEVEQRLIGDAMYVRGGMFRLGAGDGDGDGSKKWVKISLAKADGSAGPMEGMMTQLTQADPRRQLQSLLAAGDVEEVGKEKVGGVETTHYTGELAASALAANTELDAATKEQLQAAYAAAGMGDMHVDVWVDDEHRARKFVSTSPTKLGEVRMTMTFSDYGEPLDISAPPAGEVTDVSDLAGKSKAGEAVPAPAAS